MELVFFKYSVRASKALINFTNIQYYLFLFGPVSPLQKICFVSKNKNNAIHPTHSLALSHSQVILNLNINFFNRQKD